MVSEKQYERVMVFGVFDGLHAGHRDFLRQAAECGDELIAVVARDEMVQALKGKTPRRTEEGRRRAVARLTTVSRAVLGDSDSGAYGVIKKHEPDIICLGYDQQALAEDLARAMQSRVIPPIPILRLAAHEPERMHTAFLTDGQ